MASFIPFIGPAASLIGSLIGGGNKEPKPPALAAPPPPPAPPAPEPTVKPEDTIAQEQERVRSLKRRRGEYKPLASITTNTSSKSLLGD